MADPMSHESTEAMTTRSFRSLANLTPRQLASVMLRGEAPPVDHLVGWEYQGVNTPAWAKALGIRRFMKGFAARADGEVYGYNRRVSSSSLDDPWVEAKREAPGDPFAFYAVRPVDPEATDNRYLNALLLDYGDGGNPPRDPSRLLRDYVVRVVPGDDELLLGRAFLAFGARRVPVSYFVLRRYRRAPQ